MLYQLLGLPIQLFYDLFLSECTIQMYNTMERDSTKSPPDLDKTAV